ncbi:hypothetical protein NMY22_g11268 [Coprinellus aureogranulatus]|nr:hypothetical protein NMY22_g11268 [Coprinellus aureogranulatus]
MGPSSRTASETTCIETAGTISYPRRFSGESEPTAISSNFISVAQAEGSRLQHPLIDCDRKYITDPPTYHPSPCYRPPFAMSKLPLTSAHPPLGTLIHDNTIQLVEILGSGGYGVVFRGVDLSTKRHRKYAVKCMSKAKGRRSTHVRELNYHLQVSGHPGVVEMYGAVEDDKFTYFIMEYATSHDLFHQILNESRYLARDETIKDVFLQLVDGVQHCHELGVFHRDLKPENVMCFEGGARVAITDFGLATSDTSSCEFRTGSVYHMSPECQAGHYRDDAYSPMANDVWSLGIILLNIVTGRNPWKAATKDDAVYQNYLQNPSNFFSAVLPVSRPLNNILVQVLNPDWKQRMTLPEFRSAIMDLSTFYSVNVHFEGNLARYCWEAGINARTDLVDGPFGPVAKRPVPPSPPKPVSKKPVYSPIHVETKAKLVEVSAPHQRTRPKDPHRTSPSPLAVPEVRTPNAPSPYRGAPVSDPAPRTDSMVSITLDDHIAATHTQSSQGTSSPSSSFPKTPRSSPHRVAFPKRREALSTEVHISASYSPQLDPDDPVEYYGLEFCKRLTELPSDGDSDATDDTMLSPSSSQYELHEARESFSWTDSSAENSRSHSASCSSDGRPIIIRYPDIQTPCPSKPIDIVGARPRPHPSHRHHPLSPRPNHHHPHRSHPPPQPRYLHPPHPAVPRAQAHPSFRHRPTPPPPALPPRPPNGRAAGLRKVYEGKPPRPPHAGVMPPSPYERKAAIRRPPSSSTSRVVPENTCEPASTCLVSRHPQFVRLSESRADNGVELATMTSSTTASQEELKKHRVPLGWRDGCSALLIPLNVCRRKHNFQPWECDHERHTYEKCQYDDYFRRMKELAKQKQAALAEDS